MNENNNPQIIHKYYYYINGWENVISIMKNDNGEINVYDNDTKINNFVYGEEIDDIIEWTKQYLSNQYANYEIRENKKQSIKLTESQFKNMLRETTRKVLKEINNSNINDFIKYWDNASLWERDRFFDDMKKHDIERWNRCNNHTESGISSLSHNNFEAMPEIVQDTIVAYYTFVH